MMMDFEGWAKKWPTIDLRGKDLSADPPDLREMFRNCDGLPPQDAMEAPVS